MLGKSPHRCKLGPTRRAAINAALLLYDENDLLLAIDGCASDPWCAGANSMGRECTDLEWLLAKESRVEQFADRGEELRRQALASAVVPDAAPPDAAAAEIDQAQADAARQRVRDMARNLRVGSRG